MQKTVSSIYIFLLIFCPLAFGTTESWSLAVMELSCFLAVSLYLINQWYRDKPIYKTPALVPLLIFLGYILFQIVPLPPWLLELLSPNTYRLYMDTIGIVDDGSWLSISVNRKSTLLEFFRYASYVGFYFLTVQLLSNKERLQSVVGLVVIFLTSLSAFAIIQYFTSRDTIFWLIEVPINSIIFGPYVNHNHFAGLMELALPMVIALFIYLKPRISYKQSWKEKIVEIFDFQGINLYILLGFSALLIASSIVLSLSRGGMISASLSVVLLVILISLRFKQKKMNIIVFLLLISVFLSVSWFGWETVVDRFARLQNQQGEIYEARLEFWKDSIEIIKALPLVGAGFGTFSDIYPAFRTFISDRAVLHAHNDYLELLIEGGVIGLLLVSLFLIYLVKSSFKVFRKRHDRYSIYLFLGCFTGLVSIFIHSLTDFNLHIGANGLYFFFIAGLMVTSIHTKTRIEASGTLLKKISNRRMLPGIACVILIVLIGGFSINTKMLLGHYYYDSIADMHINQRMPKDKLEKVLAIAIKSTDWDSRTARYLYAKANLEVLLLKAPSALASYKEALYRQPLKGEFLQRVGFIYSWLGDDVTAEKLIKAGIRTDQSSPERYRQYAEWLLSQDRKAEGLELINKALLMEPSLTVQKSREYIVSMLVHDIDIEEVLSAIPNRTKPLLGVAEYFYSIDNYQQADRAFSRVLNWITNDPNKHVRDYGRILRFYAKKGRNNKALDIALKAVNDMPNEPRPRIWAGRLYKKLGVTYRAIEEFKMALTIDPTNISAIRELNSLNR